MTWTDIDERRNHIAVGVLDAAGVLVPDPAAEPGSSWRDAIATALPVRASTMEADKGEICSALNDAPQCGEYGRVEQCLAQGLHVLDCLHRVE